MPLSGRASRHTILIKMSMSVISLLLSVSAPAALDVPEVMDFATFKLAFNRSYAEAEVRHQTNINTFCILF